MDHAPEQFVPLPNSKADYGLDAPGAVRKLFLAAALGGICFAARLMKLWDDQSRFAKVFGGLIGLGIGCLIGGVGMIYFSRVAKLKMRDRLLKLVKLEGHERVLDVGCGRGLLLIGAARRLRAGKAIGIDIWSAADLSGNVAEATHANAVAEGVADRIEVIDADARAIPFADASFDVIISSTALHNIPSSAGREAAVREMARVLRPGGRVFITDIRHVGQYAAVFEGCGVTSKVVRLSLAGVLFPILSMGAVRPALLCGMKQRPDGLESNGPVE